MAEAAHAALAPAERASGVVRDMPALQEIVDQAHKLVDADPHADVPDVAAVYVVGLLDERPFVSRRNFPTAIRAVRGMALLNDGWEDGFGDEDWLPFLKDVANGDLTAAEVARVIASFMRRRT